MPFCSTNSSARTFSSSMFSRLPASSSQICLNASAIFILRLAFLSPPRLANMFCSWLVISSMPGGVIISTPAVFTCATSISISLSSRSPLRSLRRNTWRAELSSCFGSSVVSQLVVDRAGGSNTSRMRSSASSSARVRTFFISCSRSSFIPVSTRSRIMDSTSLPT